MESGIMQSDSVKLRHIFLVQKDSAKVDSLIAALKSGADFAAMAKQYSAVKQTAANGGEIGWLTQNVQGMDKEITTSAFSKPVKEIFTIKNAQGVQIMQVTEKTPARNKVKLAILERKVVPSSKSYSKIYNDAKQFAAELRGGRLYVSSQLNTAIYEEALSNCPIFHRGGDLPGRGRHERRLCNPASSAARQSARNPVAGHTGIQASPPPCPAEQTPLP